MRCSVIRIITKLCRMFPHYLVYFPYKLQFHNLTILHSLPLLSCDICILKLRFLFLASFLEEVSYRKLAINGNQTNIGKISQRKLDWKGTKNWVVKWSAKDLLFATTASMWQLSWDMFFMWCLRDEQSCFIGFKTTRRSRVVDPIKYVLRVF